VYVRIFFWTKLYLLFFVDKRRVLVKGEEYQNVNREQFQIEIGLLDREVEIAVEYIPNKQYIPEENQ
jgi:hypothetical protein